MIHLVDVLLITSLFAIDTVSKIMLTGMPGTSLLNSPNQLHL
jgi:hypothetical protein